MEFLTTFVVTLFSLSTVFAQVYTPPPSTIEISCAETSSLKSKDGCFLKYLSIRNSLFNSGGAVSISKESGRVVSKVSIKNLVCAYSNYIADSKDTAFEKLAAEGSFSMSECRHNVPSKLWQNKFMDWDEIFGRPNQVRGDAQGLGNILYDGSKVTEILDQVLTKDLKRNPFLSCGSGSGIFCDGRAQSIECTMAKTESGSIDDSKTRCIVTF